MTREQIERAAAYSYIDMCTVKDNWDEEMYSDGFIDGANWRINIVWHDAIEQPIEFTACLVELESQHGLFYKLKSFNKMQIKNWSGKYGCDKIVRWAYIEDLIPERKEEK